MHDVACYSITLRTKLFSLSFYFAKLNYFITLCCFLCDSDSLAKDPVDFVVSLCWGQPIKNEILKIVSQLNCMTFQFWVPSKLTIRLSKGLSFGHFIIWIHPIHHYKKGVSYMATVKHWTISIIYKTVNHLTIKCLIMVYGHFHNLDQGSFVGTSGFYFNSTFQNRIPYVLPTKSILVV